MIKDKTIVFLGSSVTSGDNGWSMCEYISETQDCTVVKWAVNGTTLADISAYSYVRRLQRNIKKQSVCDCFVCQLSTNDSRGDIPLGEIRTSKDKESFDVNTVIGAMEYIIATATEKWNCPVVFYTGTYMENAKYQKMVDALLLLREKWGIDVIDLWNDPEMRAVSAKDYEKYMRDPVHPTKLGYTEWWGPKFVSALSEILR
ncbi:MAG: SGNH/GDSL hydrolase family protein [Oscillospiraceae bacterium]|nr:SGNH/GDSL hydrolase family protein [Oscillospiraceae bacterium]MBQ9938368.1 SGNH/GDSL hydrolase family protein [Oscillospiraceae bacterium]